MKALHENDRVHNLNGHGHCRVCNDDAQVVVGTHQHLNATYETLGPCPACEAGRRLEFGQTGARLWHDGFWQGRDLPEHLVELLTTAAQREGEPMTNRGPHQ